jgi:tetratricopeptide (TPR) repeat protein
LRVNVQFIRARDDFPLWSGRYDRELTDIFAIQDEISRGVVNSLRLKLGRGRRRYETSTEAYDLYLRAHALSGGTAWIGQRSNFASIPIFEQVIAKDPSFAPAYAGLAVAYVTSSGNPIRDIPEALAKMRPAADKAVQLDPLSAESYDALGSVLAREGQWEQSEKSFLRAIEIQPNRAESHLDFATFFLIPLGRIDQAMQQLRIAEQNDPLSPLIHHWLSEALADTGRNEEAARACEKLPPKNLQREGCVLGALERQGKAGEVIQTYGARPADSPPVADALACAYARSGRRDEAEKIAARSPSAPIFACLGDKDRVFEILNRQIEVGPIRMGWFLLRVDRENPGLLRGDPRLKALRKKVGLPE